MLSKLVPLLVLLLGLAAGGGTAWLMKPAPSGETEGAELAAPEPEPPKADGKMEFVKLSNQFVVPVVENGKIASLVVISLSLEVAPGLSEMIFSLEPKLRDGFLQVLFDHANMGGFQGTFTRPKPGAFAIRITGYCPE